MPFAVNSFPYTKTINGHEIAFTDYGYCHDGPAVVTFSGWNSDHRQYSYVTSLLMEHHRVISICFRGHGPSRDSVEDFGFEDHANDVLSLLDSLGVQRFLCLAASHGNWAAMSLADLIGRERMLGLLILDHPCAEPGPQFWKRLQALQGRDTWRATTVAFFQSWLGNTQSTNVREQVLTTLGGFGHETWARSGRTVTEAYRKWGTPLNRLRHLKDPPLVHHVYCQPNTKDYEALHEEFKKENSEWFTYLNAEGETHFPHMENPALVYKETMALLDRAQKRPIMRL